MGQFAQEARQLCLELQASNPETIERFIDHFASWVKSYSKLFTFSRSETVQHEWEDLAREGLLAIRAAVWDIVSANSQRPIASATYFKKTARRAITRFASQNTTVTIPNSSKRRLKAEAAATADDSWDSIAPSSLQQSREDAERRRMRNSLPNESFEFSGFGDPTGEQPDGDDFGYAEPEHHDLELAENRKRKRNRRPGSKRHNGQRMRRDATPRDFSRIDLLVEIEFSTNHYGKRIRTFANARQDLKYSKIWISIRRYGADLQTARAEIYEAETGVQAMREVDREVEERRSDKRPYAWNDPANSWDGPAKRQLLLVPRSSGRDRSLSRSDFCICG
jgi:hypothetical protein